MKLRLLLAISLLVSSFAEYSTAQTRSEFVLQVASFTDREAARQFAEDLSYKGERTSLLTVDLGGRGRWTRVMVGSFQSFESARKHGWGLMSRGAIAEFLVAPRPPDPVMTRNSKEPDSPKFNEATRNAALGESSPRPRTVARPYGSPSAALPPPSRMKDALQLGITMDSTMVPRPLVVESAIGFLLGRAGRSGGRKAGLWLSGDRIEAAERLRWVAGLTHSNPIRVANDGRVTLDWSVVMKEAGVEPVQDSASGLRLASYIAANEGLYLLTQLTHGRHSYCLHLGTKAPTRGGLISVRGGINLDNNYDTRINPYRRGGHKLDIESPPQGFDSLIGINPGARWLNLNANSLVPQGNIVFHELAEAHAKLELELDYLSTGSIAGAHEVAIQRELRLKSERPRFGVVVTSGGNRVLGNGDETRYEGSGHGGSSRPK